MRRREPETWDDYVVETHVEFTRKIRARSKREAIYLAYQRKQGEVVRTSGEILDYVHVVEPSVPEGWRD